MNYEIRCFLRKVITTILRRRCKTCIYYDGRFGVDCCFECEKSITAVNYE